MSGGLGSGFFGSGPYGVGTPVVAPTPGTRVLVDGDGQPQNCRKIDPVTRMYVVDAFGRFQGMSSTEQMVQLAVSTNYGSSAVRTLGNKISLLQDIDESFSQEIDQTYRLALADLVARKRIEIVAITTDLVGTTGAFVRVQWRDLQTGNEVETLSGV